MKSFDSNNPIKVVLVDDHDIVREGLVSLLSTARDLRVVGSLASGAEAIAFCKDNEVDVVLLDLNMPVMDGLQCLVALRAANPERRVIMLTSENGDDAVFRALKSGAAGYLLKRCQPAELFQAVRDAVGAGVTLSPEVNAALAERSFKESLTHREIAILEHIAQGESNRLIGEALSLTEGTVKNYVAEILTKLGASDRTHAVTLALSRGIIRLPR